MFQDSSRPGPAITCAHLLCRVPEEDGTQDVGAKAPPMVMGSLKKSHEAAALISEMFMFSTAFVVGLSRTNLQFCSGLSVQQEATGPFFQGGQLWPLSQLPPPSVNIPEHRAWGRLTGRPGRSRTLRCPPAVSCWRSGGSVQTCA